ncbi:MAG: hypothetical protein ABIS67_06530 [Candidatus Eisenbacteria bacterium]
MIPNWVRPLFLAAAIYDLVLGLVFGLGFKAIYTRFGIALPNHDAYVQLPAAMIAIFGLGFWMVSRDPVRNRNLIVLGVLLKLAFSGVVLGHRFFAGIPDLWVPFAVADAIFMFAFLAALRAVPATRG